MNSLADFIPEGMRTYRAHADPDFEMFTYGDILSPRSANLEQITPGDQLWFVARLWNHDGKHSDRGWTGKSDFYIIGFLVVEVSDRVANGKVPVESVPRLSSNAHYRRIQCGFNETFRIILGDQKRSRRFHRALRVTPDVAGLIFAGKHDKSRDVFMRGKKILRNNNGKPRTFKNFCSITRTVQQFLDSDNPEHSEYVEELLRRSQCS